MKIPTKHINTKQTFMFAGALAVVATLAPAAAFAHGGGEARDGRSTTNSSERRGGDYGMHYDHYGGNYDAQKWWGKFSAESFQKMHDTKLAWLDDKIAKNNLTIENGEVLRAEVIASAETHKADLTALEQLRTSIDKSNITDEQRAALKEQTLKTFESFYDYYESLYSYKVAVKAAADTSGVEAEINVEKED